MPKATQTHTPYTPSRAIYAPPLVQAVYPNTAIKSAGRGDFSTPPDLTPDTIPIPGATPKHTLHTSEYAIYVSSLIHTDAELIRLCARHDALERQYLGLFDTITDDERDAQLALIDAVQDDLLPRILELQATTYPGWMARVRTICLSDPQVAPDAIATLATSPYSNERQMAALIRDLVAHAGLAA